MECSLSRLMSLTSRKIFVLIISNFACMFLTVSLCSFAISYQEMLKNEFDFSNIPDSVIQFAREATFSEANHEPNDASIDNEAISENDRTAKCEIISDDNKLKIDGRGGRRNSSNSKEEPLAGWNFTNERSMMLGKVISKPYWAEEENRKIPASASVKESAYDIKVTLFSLMTSITIAVAAGMKRFNSNGREGSSQVESDESISGLFEKENTDEKT